MNLLKEFDLKLLDFHLLSDITEYFLNIPKTNRDQYLDLKDFQFYLTEVTNHINLEIVELFFEFLNDLSQLTHFDYLTEKCMELSFIDEILIPILTNPIFEDQYFKELKSFEELLIILEVIEFIKNYNVIN